MRNITKGLSTHCSFQVFPSVQNEDSLVFIITNFNELSPKEMRERERLYSVKQGGVTAGALLLINPQIPKIANE
jgi:hypothetical protein